jgi:hypothetical protein
MLLKSLISITCNFLLQFLRMFHISDAYINAGLKHDLCEYHYNFPGFENVLIWS